MKWQRRLLKGLAIHVAIASVIRRMERRLYQSWKSKKRKEKQQQKCFLLVSTGVGESWSATITLIGWSEPVTNSDWTDSSSNHLSFLVAPFPDGCDDKPSDTSGLQIFFFQAVMSSSQTVKANSRTGHFHMERRQNVCSLLCLRWLCPNLKLT